MKLQFDLLNNDGKMENDVKEIFDKIKKITSSVKPAVLEVPLFDPKSMIKKIDFPEIDFQDNVLFQMENNQKKQIKELKKVNKILVKENEQLRLLNDKKDKELAEIKQNAKKERIRFWWTYVITTGFTIVGIIVSIIVAIYL